MLLDVVVPIFITILAWFITNAILFTIDGYKRGEFNQIHSEDEKPEEIYLKIELVDNKYILVYNLQTNEFLVQVKTYEEMQQFFKDNYPYHNVIASVDNVEEIFGNIEYESV